MGSEDGAGLMLNRQALESLGGRRELALVPGAKHLFDEPATLEEVARLAGAWLTHYLTPRPFEATG
ncbi:MAG: hypothetical protein QM820_62685 [Minicystis sp.]